MIHRHITLIGPPRLAHVWQGCKQNSCWDQRLPYSESRGGMVLEHVELQPVPLQSGGQSIAVVECPAIRSTLYTPPYNTSISHCPFNIHTLHTPAGRSQEIDEFLHCCAATVWPLTTHRIIYYPACMLIICEVDVPFGVGPLAGCTAIPHSSGQ